MNLSNKSSFRALLLALMTVSLLSACGGTKATKATKPEAATTAGGSAKATKATKATKAKAAGETPASEVAEPQGTPEEQFAAALASLKAKNFTEARVGFEKLAKEHPELSGPLANLGVLDAKANKREAAIADFSRAVAANSENAMAYNWLGQLYRETKAYPESERAYLRAIQAKSGYAQPQLNLGILYEVYLNRPGEALTRYRNYQELTGNKDLKVTAWIKGLEAAGVVPPASSSPAAKPVEAPSKGKQKGKK